MTREVASLLGVPLHRPKPYLSLLKLLYEYWIMKKLYANADRNSGQ